MTFFINTDNLLKIFLCIYADRFILCGRRYNFDFVALRQGYKEKELKDALMNNVQNFLMELGTGFAFVGEQYLIKVEDNEFYIDLLFYNFIVIYDKHIHSI